MLACPRTVQFSFPIEKALCGTVADWLERSTCNAEYSVSSLVRDSYCVGTLSKFFEHNCTAILLHLCRRGVEVHF